MLDLLLGPLIDIAVEVGGEIIEFAGEALLGVGVALLVYKIAEKITESNLPDLIRKMIRDKSEAIFKKLAGKTISMAIKSKKNKEITLEFLEARCKELEKQEFKIESSQGVNDSLRVGKKITVTV